MTSYQRRKESIKYLRQCLAELEGLIKEIVKRNPGITIPVSPGINPDEFITPYNSGPFAMDLVALAGSNQKALEATYG